MSRNSSAVILGITVVITLFIAGAAFFFNPNAESDSLSSRIMEEARQRQNETVSSVEEPLETDLTVRSDDEKMASLVAERLKNDESFLSSVGEKSTEYAENRLTSLEKEYSESLDSRASSLEKSVDEKTSSLEKSVDEKTSSLEKSVDEKISSLEKSVDEKTSSLEKSVDGKISALESEIPSTEDIISALLADETFMTKLVSQVKAELGSNDYDTDSLARAVVESDAFWEALEKYRGETSSAASDSPLPSTDTSLSADMTESEYVEARDERRSEELAQVLSFLGY